MLKKLSLLLLYLTAFLICLPILLVLLGSLKSTQELMGSLSPILGDANGMVNWSPFPLYPTLNHFYKLLFLTPSFFIVFWNSMKIVFCILAGQLFISLPAAWAFACYSFPLKKPLFTLYIILMLMPFQVTMLSSYLVLGALHMLDTHRGIILPAIFSAYPVFIIYRSFTQIPKSLLEAARTDGAGEFYLFLHIGIPSGSSGILSAFVLGFLEYWSLIEPPLAFLKDKSLWPLSLYLPEISIEQAGMAFTASVITLIPAIFVFIIGQDYLEQGIMSSAVKE